MLADNLLLSNRVILTLLLSFAIVLFSLQSTFASNNKKADAELLNAVNKNDTDKVLEILKLYKDVNVDVVDNKGRTALLIATWNNNFPVAKALIDRGADVNKKDNQEDSAYLVAGAEGRVEILKYTIKHGADINSINRYGGTALIPASEHGHVEAVRELINAGVDLDHINKLGWTALLEAIILGGDDDRHLEVVNLLISAGADINISDSKGVSPLKHAQDRKFSRIEKALIKAGAN